MMTFISPAGKKKQFEDIKSRDHARLRIGSGLKIQMPKITKWKSEIWLKRKTVGLESSENIGRNGSFEGRKVWKFGLIGVRIEIDGLLTPRGARVFIPMQAKAD